MLKKLSAIAVILSLSFTSSVSFAEEVKCGASAQNPDAECTNGTVCILVLKPPVCKPPLEAGQACKRDKVCASNKCEIPAGAEKGVCK